MTAGEYKRTVTLVGENTEKETEIPKNWKKRTPV